MGRKRRPPPRTLAIRVLLPCGFPVADVRARFEVPLAPLHGVGRGVPGSTPVPAHGVGPLCVCRWAWTALLFRSLAVVPHLGCCSPSRLSLRFHALASSRGTPCQPTRVVQNPLAPTPSCSVWLEEGFELGPAQATHVPGPSLSTAAVAVARAAAGAGTPPPPVAPPAPTSRDSVGPTDAAGWDGVWGPRAPAATDATGSAGPASAAPLLAAALRPGTQAGVQASRVDAGTGAAGAVATVGPPHGTPAAGVPPAPQPVAGIALAPAAGALHVAALEPAVAAPQISAPASAMPAADAQILGAGAGVPGSSGGGVRRDSIADSSVATATTSAAASAVRDEPVSGSATDASVSAAAAAAASLPVAGPGESASGLASDGPIDAAAASPPLPLRRVEPTHSPGHE